jgi:BsaWI restriction endonuclease type 2
MNAAECYDQVKDDLTGFGENAVADVGKIMTLVQTLGLPEKDVMPTAQYVYITHYQEVNAADANQARQSWVAASGNNFESFMRNFINHSLNPEGILAVKGDRLRASPEAANIVRFLTLRANRRCTQTTTGVWPDSDIVVLTKDAEGTFKAFALLNCKTSDHSRNDAVLFWALALRDNNIKYCLLTQDLDGRFDRGDNDPRVSALRRKAEAFLDRVYSTSPSTTECSQVKRLDFNSPNGADSLLSDLRRWRQDVVPDFSITALHENLLFGC